jgi:hypothetical protein
MENSEIIPKAGYYEREFLPTEDENKCRICGYKFYCPKWDEK